LAAYRRKKQRWHLDHMRMFEADSIIVWMGESWYSEFGIFHPTDWWWRTWVVHVSPVATTIPKRVSLRLFEEPKAPNPIPIVQPSPVAPHWVRRILNLISGN
jgi:hypothetical protein